MSSIQIRDDSGNLVGEIDNSINYMITRSANNICNYETIAYAPTKEQIISCCQISDNDKDEGEKKNMSQKIIEVYKNRKLTEIETKFEDNKRKALEEDKINNIIRKANEEIAKIIKEEYDREPEKKVLLSTSIYARETEKNIEKLEIEKHREQDELYKLIDEVEAVLDLTSDYKEVTDILRNYKILDRNDKINA